MTPENRPFIFDHVVLQGIDALDAHEKRTYVGMSGLGNCTRAQYYRGFPDEYPEEHDLETRQLFREGYLHEKDVIDVLRAGGLQVICNGYEVTWPEAGYEDVVGHIDGLITFKPPLPEVDGDELVIPSPLLLEIKSVRGFAWKRYFKEGLVRVAWPHYYMQVQAYLHALRSDPFLREYPPTESCLFVLKNREGGQLAAEWIDYDEAMTTEVMERALRVLQARRSRQAPPRDFNPSKDWQCKKNYCAFRDECAQEGAR